MIRKGSFPGENDIIFGRVIRNRPGSPYLLEISFRVPREDLDKVTFTIDVSDNDLIPIESYFTHGVPLKLVLHCLLVLHVIVNVIIDWKSLVRSNDNNHLRKIHGPFTNMKGI